MPTVTDNFDSGAMDTATSFAGTTLNITCETNFNSAWGWYCLKMSDVAGREIDPVIQNPTARYLTNSNDIMWGWYAPANTSHDSGATPDIDAANWTQYAFTHGATVSLTSPGVLAEDDYFISLYPAYPFSRTERKVVEWGASEYVSSPSGVDNYVVSNLTARTNFNSRAIPATPIYALKVTDSTVSDIGKKTVVLTAGNHPGETQGRWMLEGIMDWLTGSTDEAELFRQKCITYVLPAVNPQGQHGGYYRTTPEAPTTDHNRVWDVAEGSAQESINAVRDAISQITGDVVFAHLDFHGLYSREVRPLIRWTEDTASNEAFVTAATVEHKGTQPSDWDAITGHLNEHFESTYSSTLEFAATPDETQRNNHTIALWQAFAVDMMEAAYDTLWPATGRSVHQIIGELKAITTWDAMWIAGVGVTEASNAVSAWEDRSGNEISASQATGANQPTYRASGGSPGGRPDIVFDGTNDRLDVAADVISEGVKTMLVLARKDSTNTQRWITALLHDVGPKATQLIASTYDPDNEWMRLRPLFDQAATASPPFVPWYHFSYSVLAVTFDGTAGAPDDLYYRIWINSQEETVADLGGNLGLQNTQGHLGARGDSTGFFDGPIAAILVAPSEMSEADVLSASALLEEYRDTVDGGIPTLSAICDTSINQQAAITVRPKDGFTVSASLESVSANPDDGRRLTITTSDGGVGGESTAMILSGLNPDVSNLGDVMVNLLQNITTAFVYLRKPSTVSTAANDLQDIDLTNQSSDVHLTTSATCSSISTRRRHDNLLLRT